ncbi:hypothetical protein HMPREF9373_0131, partial [Psychrobacter sp. 1501(2011)]
MAQKTQLVIKKNNAELNSVILENTQKSKFTATEDMQISLVDAETGRPVTNLKAKKVGNDLIVASDSGEEFLTIEDYYALENVEIGTMTDVGFVEFKSIESSAVEATGIATSQSSYTPLIIDMLNGPATVESTATAGFSNKALWGGLGALAVGAVAVGSSSSSSSGPRNNSPKSTDTAIKAVEDTVATG